MPAKTETSAPASDVSAKASRETVYTDLMTVSQAAAWYAENLGWAVVPYRTWRGSDGKMKKGPTTHHAYMDATSDPEGVRRLWAEFPGPCVGVSNGAPSGGLVSMDLDSGHAEGVDGAENLREWLRARGLGWPETLQDRTPSGGMHLYFTDPAGKLAAAQGCGRAIAAIPGVDLLAAGGGCILPPSKRSDGAYSWVPGRSPADMKPAELPAWALELAEEYKAKRKNKEGKGGACAWDGESEIPEGARNDTLYRYAYSLLRGGATKEDAAERVRKANAEKCVPPLPDSEVHTIMDSAEKAPQARGKVYALCDAIRENRAFSMLAYDTFTRRTYAQGMPWRAERHAWDDVDQANMHACLQTARKGVTRLDALDAVAIVTREREYSSLLRELEGLPAWDGTPRAPFVFTDFLGAFGRFPMLACWAWMCAAVERAYNPGTKFEGMPILIGAQGIGKSTLLRMLALRDAWFLDSVPDLTDQQKAGELLQGKWIVELPEMVGIRKRDDDAVKGFLSKQADTYRAAYGRHAEDRPRTCVIAGTTNRRGVLTDQTGGRRFWPIFCDGTPTKSVFCADAREHLGQAWAEVLAKRAAMLRGEPVGEWPYSTLLGPEGEELAERARGEAESEDPFASPIAAFLESHGVPGGRVCVAMLAAEALGMESARMRRDEQGRITDYMDNRAKGWRRMGGKQRAGKYSSATCWEFCGDSE